MMARLAALLARPGRRTYSQLGEDRIAEFFFWLLGVQKPYYLDLGANHPTRTSNTYLFYLAGGRGVCVEPDPVLFRRFQRARPRDVCVNAGVTDGEPAILPFYVFQPDTLSTFDKAIADQRAALPGHRLQGVVEVPTLRVSDIAHRYCRERPNFLSIDVEGLDLRIVRSIDFATFRPEVVCIETLEYMPQGGGRVISEIGEHMTAVGYTCAAYTYINSVFILRSAWEAAGLSPLPRPS